MNTDKIDPRKKDTAAVTGELSEEQLNSVSGGDNKTTTKTTGGVEHSDFKTVKLVDVATP